MKFERSDVEFPLWRKKVDTSLFEHKGTTIPGWVVGIWDLNRLFGQSISKKSKDSEVGIYYENKKYKGWVTVAKQGRKTPAFRLWFDEELCLSLKRVFLMSYMRSLEQGLSRAKNIEDDIPFWEFLDIEFDQCKREFKFAAYYRQTPSFPELFKRLLGSPSLQKIDDALEGKEKVRIYKQGWKPRRELEYEIGAKNVIYNLIDSKNKLIYAGEAKDLVKRLLQPHRTIPNWDYFRYNVLPDKFAPHRVDLERMMIRDFAELFNSRKGASKFSLSNFKLTNDKVDLK